MRVTIRKPEMVDCIGESNPMYLWNHEKLLQCWKQNQTHLLKIVQMKNHPLPQVVSYGDYCSVLSIFLPFWDPFSNLITMC